MVREIILEEYVRNYIQYRAAGSNAEVYGWLVGYDNPEGDVFITAPLDCTMYTRQSIVDALPDPAELHIVSSMTVQGMGIIGIYHSHPGQVFHSSTDNQTVLNLARMYPNIVSIVTNGEETRYYRVLDKEIKEVQPTFTTLPASNYMNFRIPIDSHVYIGSENTPKQVKPLVSTQLNEALQRSLGKIKYRVDGKRLKPKHRLSKFPPGSDVELQLHWYPPSKDNPIIRGETRRISFEVELKARVVYKENETLIDLQEAILNELADDLIQKIHHGEYLPLEKRYKPAQTLFIQFMNAHLKLYAPTGEPEPHQHRYCIQLIDAAHLLIKLGKTRAAVELLRDLEQYFGKVRDKTHENKVQETLQFPR